VILTALIEVFNKTIMIGDFMTYINTSTKVENYINSITDSLFALYTDSLYCENIVSFIEYIRISYEDKKFKTERLNENIEKIELQNISYKYPNSNHYVLKNINLVIENDDIVAFVGENGSGKTTLIKLLLGLYEDYEGTILINNLDLKNLNRKAYLENISTIFQDYNNYEYTIMDNIKFGNIQKEMEIEYIEKVAMLTNAHEFIKKLPNKYQQQVGNWFAGGMQLSGGQWQKLALSRGIAKNADIYIFDEPTSSLDPSSEYLFFKNMLTLFKEKIGIFVTHRFINAKIANKIIVFENGEITEMGTHEELLVKNGYYSKMHKLQQEGITKDKNSV
jgi:ABC-type multidrug transport system fused ATPase/permease subunit